MGAEAKDTPQKILDFLNQTNLVSLDTPIGKLLEEAATRTRSNETIDEANLAVYSSCGYFFIVAPCPPHPHPHDPQV